MQESKKASEENSLFGIVFSGYKEEILYNEGCETLERVAQRGGGGAIPGNIQDHVGQVSEQPDLVSGVPAHCKGVGLHDL